VPGKIIDKPNCTVFIPTFENTYTTDISVLVFYPGNTLNSTAARDTFVKPLKEAIVKLRDKYVIVVANQQSAIWSVVKKEYTEVMSSIPQGDGKDPNYILKEKTVSISLFASSGMGNTDIQKNLVSIDPTHLLIMNTVSGTLIQNVKTLISKGTSCYLMYDLEFFNVMPDLKALMPSLVAAVDAGGNKSVRSSHTDVVLKSVNLFAPEMEKKLVTPTLIEADKPVTENPDKPKNDESVAADANQPTETTQSTSPKWNVTINGLGDSAVGAAPVAYEISAKKDLPSFTIYVGNPETDWVSFGDVSKEDLPENGEIFDNVEGLDEEYGEEDFKGAEELGITFEEYKLQDQISSGQESGNSGVTEPGTPAVIAPVSSFDALLKLAGSCARELGKNPRVKWENLRQGYIKGVHGLCPQGTQAVLYAMTGVKAVGQLSGNADYFSFRGGGKSKFPSKYFNDKIKVGKDYWKNKSQWQIGDVIAVGYTGGKPYGHIQVWTGTNWMSDFKQNALQSSHVDWDTPALWRLNATGVDAVKKQMKSIT
jgi:hypothetical protein